ncbi:hypothetical protein DMZ48_04600 [Robertkochia solimangrovi]|nr:hypothetical protein DMZ48_04600 [Robertkochia solimangrovi]
MFWISCASIPKEAPQLSSEIGYEIQKLENDHLALLEIYFELKRKEVKRFVREIWLPEFATNFFSDPQILEVWNQVVTSDSEEDKVNFILYSAPQLQVKINEQYERLTAPLDKMELELKTSISQRYTEIKGVNNALTSYLYSASKIDENRQRYLDMAGIQQDEIYRIISETETITNDIANQAEGAQNGLDDIEGLIKSYEKKINELLNELK